MVATFVAVSYIKNSEYVKGLNTQFKLILIVVFCFLEDLVISMRTSWPLPEPTNLLIMLSLAEVVTNEVALRPRDLILFLYQAVMRSDSSDELSVKVDWFENIVDDPG